MITVPANHPDIVYSGRVDRSLPERATFAFPGVSIRARFQGSRIDMLLKDHGTPDIINYYNVIIDNQFSEVIAVSPEKSCYTLARNLAGNEHAIEIFKRGESGPDGHPNAGKAEFLGFRLPEGRTLLPLKAKERRLEFIGDSITCGYGNELATDTPDDFPYTTRNTNAYNAFGAIAARTLNAEYLAVAYSGRGLVRNYEGAPGETLPDMYLATVPEDPDSVVWDISSYVPDAVVINLGTNDFSEGLEPDALDGLRDIFRTAYAEFLDRLRGYYPDAIIIACLGPMISDTSPPGLYAWTHIQEDLHLVIDERRNNGDVNVHLLIFPPQSGPFGEQWHPTVDTHRQMADTLVRFVVEIGLFS